MLLVFFSHPQDPAECAVQLARGLKPYPEIKLRVGVHSGPLGEKDAAFDVLNKSFERHETMLWLRCEPLFDPLRSDPRFEALLKRLDDLQRR
jgi:hypothetical protein